MTKLDIETIKKVRNYWDAKYKTALLWESFTPEKRDLEWYKKKYTTFFTFCRYRIL